MIKKYLEFIRENKSEVKILDKPKNISEKLLKELLIDFYDNDWYIEIGTDIMEEQAFTEEGYFRDAPIYINSPHIFAYEIILSSTQRTSYDSGISNRLIFINNYLKNKNNRDVVIKAGAGEVYNVEEIKINENNEFVLIRTNEIIGNEIRIGVIDNELGEITAKELFNYYNLEYDYEKDGNVFIDIKYDIMVDAVRSDYGSILKYGFKQDIDWGYIDLTDDLNLFLSLFSKENFYLLVDVYLKQNGGWENYYKKELNELDIDKNINSLDELKEFLYNERFYETSESFFTEEELLTDIERIYNNLYEKKLIKENYKIVENAFTDVVYEETSAKLITKVVKENNGEEKEEKYFRLLYTNDWLSDVHIDGSDMFRFTSVQILEEYLDSIIPFKMRKIEFVDDINVDNEEFNNEVNKYLKKQIQDD